MNTDPAVDLLKCFMQRVIISFLNVGLLVLPGFGTFFHVEKLNPFSVHITFFAYFVQDKPDKDTVRQYGFTLVLCDSLIYLHVWGFICSYVLGYSPIVLPAKVNYMCIEGKPQKDKNL